MTGYVVAAVMAREATRRRLTEPPRARPRSVRRLAARVLSRAARRPPTGTAAGRTPVGA